MSTFAAFMQQIYDNYLELSNFYLFL